MEKVIKSEDLKSFREAMGKHCKDLESIIEMCTEADALLTKINSISKEYGFEISVVHKSIENGKDN